MKKEYNPTPTQLALTAKKYGVAIQYAFPTKQGDVDRSIAVTRVEWEGEAA